MHLSAGLLPDPLGELSLECSSTLLNWRRGRKEDKEVAEGRGGGNTPYTYEMLEKPQGLEKPGFLKSPTHLVFGFY